MAQNVFIYMEASLHMALNKSTCEPNCIGRSLSYILNNASQRSLANLHHQSAKSTSITWNLTHRSPKTGLSLLLNHLQVKSIQLSWDPECVCFLMEGTGRPKRCSALETDVQVWAINQLMPKVTLEGARFFRLGNQPEQDVILFFFILSSSAGCKSLQLLHQTDLWSAQAYGGTCISWNHPSSLLCTSCNISKGFRYKQWLPLVHSPYY